MNNILEERNVLQRQVAKISENFSQKPKFVFVFVVEQCL